MDILELRVSSGHFLVAFQNEKLILAFKSSTCGTNNTLDRLHNDLFTHFSDYPNNENAKQTKLGNLNLKASSFQVIRSKQNPQPSALVTRFSLGKVPAACMALVSHSAPQSSPWSMSSVLPRSSFKSQSPTKSQS